MQTTRPNSNTVGAFILIGLGVLFLIAQVTGWGFLGLAWPLIIVAPGVLFLAAAYFGDTKQAGFYVPGMVITGTGALLWYQNVSGNWQSWAYMWSIYPVLVGVALILMGNRTGNEKQLKDGRGLLTTGLILFLVFAGFFELFIFNDFGGLWGIVLPVALIVIGIVMLRGGRVNLPFITVNDSTDKPKNSDVLNTSGARKNDLQSQIDAALNEDEQHPAPRA